jgi:hypothetical protein
MGAGAQALVHVALVMAFRLHDDGQQLEHGMRLDLAEHFHAVAARSRFALQQNGIEAARRALEFGQGVGVVVHLHDGVTLPLQGVGDLRTAGGVAVGNQERGGGHDVSSGREAEL